MKHFIFVAALVTLSGCLPLKTYYRAGATPDQLDRDLTACEVSALQNAPVALQTRQAAPVWVRPVRHCNAAGACHVRPGYYRPGHVYQEDVNRPLRSKLTTQCMADKGYSQEQIPACPVGVRKAAPQGATTVLPKLSARSCVIRNDDKSILIVNRG